MRPPSSSGLAKILSHIQGMVARAVVRNVDDAPRMQELKLAILGTELAGKAEHFQPYGLTSVALPGAEAVVVFALGNRDHPLVVCVDDRRDRPTNLAPGEVMLYGHAGQTVHLKADGSLVIDTPGAVSVTSAGAVSVDAASVSASATGSLALSCGPSSITLTPAGVSIKGVLVNIDPP